MSVDSRYSGSDLSGESTKTTIPDDYGAHIVRFGLFYRHGKLSGAFMGWTHAVSSVITSVLLPAMFIHTTYIGRLEYAEDLKYEDIGDDKDKDV